MSEDTYIRDVLVVGGGLGGLVAANQIGQLGLTVVLIDSPAVAQAKDLGGFAEFSGAKFSLPPAGLGLVPIAGSIEELNESIDGVLNLLGLSDRATVVRSSDSQLSTGSGQGTLGLRAYQSIVLTPDEMTLLIRTLVERISRRVTIIRGTCESLAEVGAVWNATVRSLSGQYSNVRSSIVVYAGGRVGTDLLSRAGAVERKGKGLDVGLRVEFDDGDALSRLRAHGPDAKFLEKNCRTFCLNVPGEILRYVWEDISIPGGIVAAANQIRGNVGFLCRVADKATTLQRCRVAFRDFATRHPELCIHGGLGDARSTTRQELSGLFGTEAADQLMDFRDVLEKSGLLDFSKSHRVHLPLLDWHWKVFGDPESLQTSVNRLFVIGDSAGHARGLLQAAVSGWLLTKAIRR